MNLSKLISILIIIGMLTLVAFLVTHWHWLLDVSMVVCGSASVVAIVACVVVFVRERAGAMVKTWAMMLEEPDSKPMILGYAIGTHDEAMETCRDAVGMLCMLRGKPVFGRYCVTVVVPQQRAVN